MKKNTIKIALKEKELLVLNQIMASLFSVYTEYGKLPLDMHEMTSDFLELVDKVDSAIHDNGLCEDPSCPNTKIIEF
jgi:hypothetical protein